MSPCQGKGLDRTPRAEVRLVAGLMGNDPHCQPSPFALPMEQTPVGKVPRAPSSPGQQKCLSLTLAPDPLSTSFSSYSHFPLIKRL